MKRRNKIVQEITRNVANILFLCNNSEQTWFVNALTCLIPILISPTKLTCHVDLLITVCTGIRLLHGQVNMVLHVHVSSRVYHVEHGNV